MLLVDREPQVQQLELAIVPVQEISPCGAVLPSPPHVLPEAVEGGALFSIPLRVVAVRVLDVGLERGDPVNLVGGLERHREHGRLRHVEGRLCLRAQWHGGVGLRDLAPLLPPSCPPDGRELGLA